MAIKKENIVALNQQEYNRLLETLYLLSIPSIKEKLEVSIEKGKF